MKKALALTLLFPAAALAHDGHGATSQAHWLTEPDHLVVVVLGALAALLAVARLAAVLVRRPGRTREQTHE